MKHLHWMRYITSVLILCTIFGVTLGTALRNLPAEEVSAPAFYKNSDAPVLIIDAGHGGEDGGAVSVTGEYESDINLAISQKLDLLAAFLGQRTVMTRESDDISYPDGANTTRARKVADQKNRVSLINSTQNAVLISIHQNKFSTSAPFGTQVFFAPTDKSEQFAVHMQELFVSQIDPQNRRTAVKIPKSIYLMNSIDCPAILIECGFLSNGNEARLLCDPSYQTKLAAVISGGFSSYRGNFSAKDIGGTNES